MILKTSKIALDDNDGDLLLLADYLKEHGINDVLFFNHEDKLWQEFDENVMVAIVDYTLPLRDGLEVAAEILKRNKYCKVIIYSGTHDRASIKKAFNEVGIYKWIDKDEPNHMKLLVKYITEAVEYFDHIRSLHQKALEI